MTPGLPPLAPLQKSTAQVSAQPVFLCEVDLGNFHANLKALGICNCILQEDRAEHRLQLSVGGRSCSFLTRGCFTPDRAERETERSHPWPPGGSGSLPLPAPPPASLPEPTSGWQHVVHRQRQGKTDCVGRCHVVTHPGFFLPSIG